MTPYPLAALLSLRIFRQDKAMRALQSCERKLIEAKKAVKEAIRKHAGFLEWLAEEEDRRYAEIMTRQMSLDDVDDFKAGLLAIRARESIYLDDILKARNHVQICEDHVKEARSDLLAAQKGTMKIEVHQERWLELVKRDALRAEELEMEDFKPARNDLFDDPLTA